MIRRSRQVTALALVLVLVSILQFVNAFPVLAAGISLGTTSGTPGTGVIITGNAFAANEFGITVTWDGTTVASGIVASAAGAWTSQFIVPPSASGVHTVVASGPTTPGVSAIFTVTAGVSLLSQTTGPVGSSVTVTGIGFGNAETGISITYDGATVASGIAANSQGAWSAPFSIPASASGTHAIRAFGSLTSATRDIIFTISPVVTISRSTGAGGSSITVSGTGFGAAESGIVVTYDGSPVASGISASSAGSWSTTLTVPPSSAGAHAIHAYGATTQASSVQEVSFTISAGISLSQTRGAAGTSVTVTGSGFGANETGITVTYDGNPVASGIEANAQGAWLGTFVVPSSAAGSHAIRASGATTTTVPSATFTVSAGISVNKSSGAPGSQITVTGAGFGTGETGISITFDTTSVASGIRAGAQGGWTSTFTVPTSPAGFHNIVATGSTTTNVPEVPFTVTATVSVAQPGGTPGSQVTVTGAGFVASETGITVTYDGTNVASNIRANAQGGWTATFQVPASAAGPHTIRASGAITQAARIQEVIFTLGPAVSLSQATGVPGGSVTVTGAGFAANETGIVVTYDNTTVASGIRANAQGAWTTSFSIPPSAAGSHGINVRGSITQTSTVAEVSLSIAAAITLSPANGAVGATVAIEGSGFNVNSALRFTFDDREIPAEGASTDGSGSFRKSVVIPKTKAGAHTIRVVDGQRNEARVNFVMENTPPPVPAPSIPDDGARIGLLGGAMPELRWTNVTDPSGVAYMLQIDSSPDFSQPLVDKADLTGSRYILTAAEALPLGDYYWRVRAVDGAGNQSAWSQPRLLKSGLMSGITLFLIILVLIVAAGVAGYIFLVRRPALRRQGVGVAQPEPVITVTGEWRQLESSSESTRDRPLPLRLALPEPKKGAKTLSTEDQARLRVVADFAQSLPLVQPTYDVNWLMDLLESGVEPSAMIYEQLLKSELQLRYEPAWMRHPIYQDLMSIMEGQPTLQDLHSFIDLVNRCAAEAVALLQEIYRDTLPDVPAGLLQKGGWAFVAGIYADAMSWFLGKSLREPLPRDYVIRRGDSEDEFVLAGEASTAFSGPLVRVADESEGGRLRELHLRLRKNYRNNPEAKAVAGMITQLEVQRSRLLNVFSQFGRLKQ